MKRTGKQKSGLEDLCKDIKSILGDGLIFVEIGVYAGGSTEIFSDFFPKSLICAVDKWEKYLDEGFNYDLDKQQKELDMCEIVFDKMVKKRKNIIKNKMSSEEYSKFFEDETVDAIYIDGGHSYDVVLNDFICWFPKIKKGGVISGHDYCWPSVKRAISETFINVNKVYQDGSWILRK